MVGSQNRQTFGLFDLVAPTQDRLAGLLAPLYCRPLGDNDDVQSIGN